MHRRLPISIVLSAAGLCAQPRIASLHCDTAVPQIQFAAGEIHRALSVRGITLAEGALGGLGGDTAPTRFVLASGADAARIAAQLGVAAPKSTAPQAYAIRVKQEGRTYEKPARRTYIALSSDAAGAMYGGLDLAEAIRLDTLDGLRDSDHTPHIAQRGIKFNIPLDVRTPSYSDSGDAAQQNIPEMWSFDFWRTFLDELARHRYNVLSLWSLHPFPFLVKVPEYPDVALDECTTTLKLDDTFSFNGTDMITGDAAQCGDRRRSDADKIRSMARCDAVRARRGIAVSCLRGTSSVRRHRRIRRPPAQDNAVTIDYFRKSVRETVLTYPLLAGMGITAGEEMKERSDEFGKEPWLWKTYGEGIRDALSVQSGRDFRLIHRYHQTALAPILEAWKPYPSLFDLSFKYSVAHMLSSPAPPFARESLTELPANLRMWMTVRNDDIYSFRWADPEYARAYIKNLPGPDKLAGFYMGPDGTVWGRDFLSAEPETPRPRS
jgi:hypothetical protein